MNEINRRDFLVSSAAALTALSGAAAGLPQRARADARLIDTNVTLSRWPYRRLPLDETGKLVEKLRKNGVIEAWAGSFDGLLHKDLASVNSRLADECGRHGQKILKPFGSINPMLPQWETDLRKCHEQHHMAGIRLHPNYHGYKLEDSRVCRLLG